ncbi:LytR/AlgR family response regulator transcription factor [Terriglobus sp. RCC_193]|uniref:LytR/AlgR family response regulator transcription factor n=1 Tax=Terriglobus sp. RCC_193 TaxID=3239218 RepID=UPI003523F5C8
MTVRSLIIDDEALARARMARLLSMDPEIAVSGECRNSREAAHFLDTNVVDVVFLDIQMPGEGGFDLIHKVGVRNMPLTVFVTAHDSYALKAFEVHALDYLTKPVEEDRLRIWLERIKERLALKSNGFSEETLRSLLTNLAPQAEPAGYRNRLLLPDGAKTLLLDVDQIMCIEAADYYVSIYTGNKEYLLRESMKELASTLDPKKFLRIHRSVIVNISCIREVIREGRGEGTAILTNGRRLRMSDSGWKAVLASGGHV